MFVKQQTNKDIIDKQILFFNARSGDNFLTGCHSRTIRHY